MSNNISVEGVMVLGGLADPCGDIGTQGRYDLVAIPWDSGALRASIIGTIKADTHARWVEELPPDTEIGLRIWICHPPVSEPLELLLRDGLTEKGFKDAATLIDRLSFSCPSIEFSWTSDALDDETALAAIEKTLCFKLQNCD